MEHDAQMSANRSPALSLLLVLAWNQYPILDPEKLNRRFYTDHGIS